MTPSGARPNLVYFVVQVICQVIAKRSVFGRVSSGSQTDMLEINFDKIILKLTDMKPRILVS